MNKDSIVKEVLSEMENLKVQRTNLARMLKEVSAREEELSIKLDEIHSSDYESLVLSLTEEYSGKQKTMAKAVRSLDRQIKKIQQLSEELKIPFKLDINSSALIVEYTPESIVNVLDADGTKDHLYDAIIFVFENLNIPFNLDEPGWYSH